MLLYLVVVASFGKVSHPVAQAADQRTSRRKIADWKGLFSTTLDNIKSFKFEIPGTSCKSGTRQDIVCFTETIIRNG